MKKMKLLCSLLVLFTAIGFTSCDTEPVDPLLIGENPGETGPASFEVDFSGDTYQTETATAAIENGTITLTATRSDGAMFIIVVPGTTAGTYNTPVITYKPSPTAAGIYTNISPSGISGTVHIATVNTTTHKITGTFSFTGYWSDTAANLPAIPFTNGLFENIAYTGGGVVEPVGDPLFTVKIDGVLYTADDYQATVGNGLTSVVGFRGANGEYVGILIDGIAEGEYTEEAIFSYSNDPDGEIEYSNLSLDPANDDLGYVNITEINTTAHTISGTFHFTGYLDGAANKNFTEGTFENIPYTDAGSTPTDEVFNATVDGTAYTYGGTDLIVGVIDDNQINMQAIADDHEIRLYLNNPIEGSYPISNEIGAQAKAWFTDADGVEHAINNGSILVTSIDDSWIEGTFSYDVVDSQGVVIHTVTNGVFNVEYNW
jgi:Family of unknown function (DUF6252)